MLALQHLDGTPHFPSCDDAYVRVRLVDPARPASTVTVYLPNGTALVVPRRDLVTVAAPADPRT